MLSKRFGENLFDEMFDDPFELMPMFSRHNPLYGKHAKALMRPTSGKRITPMNWISTFRALRRMKSRLRFQMAT